MKIKLLIFMFSLAGGGAQRTIVNVINNIDLSKFEIILVLGNANINDYSHILDNRVRIINLNKARIRHCLVSLAKCINVEKPDSLFTTMNSNNIMLLSAKLLSFRNIPVIVRVTNNHTESGKLNFLTRNITRVVYNYIADTVIAISEGVKNDLVNNYKIRSEKIELIYNPIDIDMIHRFKHELVTEINLKKEKKYIIAVGRLVEQKDYITLIKAFKIVLKVFDSELLILGDGPEKDNIFKQAIKEDITNKIHFLGYTKNPFKFMNNSDVFILTSRWEGFGHVIVEAMASGVPVISTDCKSGPAEIIKNNVNGKLVKVGDYKGIALKIIETLNSDNEEIISEGKKRAKDFDVRKIIKEYEYVFIKSILNDEYLN